MLPSPPSDVRERILATASELFYANGIRATGVDTIIAASGVAKASFYRHFPSKDDLVLAFLERRDALWRDWLRESVERLATDPADRPLAVFDALAERFARKDFRGCAFINSMIELADREHVGHIAAATHKSRVRDYLESLLARASRPDARPLADELLLLIDGAIVSAVREGSPEPARRARAIAARLLEPRTKARLENRPKRG